jgi:nucleoside-diphosphate-sugar epimerase
MLNTYFCNRSFVHVAVTGATGFIGTHLCKELLKKGFKVTGIARSSGHHAIWKELNSLGEFQRARCDIAKEDNNDLIELFRAIEPVDAVFHLAGQAYRRDLLEVSFYFRNNFFGTLNMLECCRIFKIHRFIFSSSYAVYGLGANQNIPEYLPVDESYVVKPFDFYGASKYHAEQICKFYHERFGIESCILRYSKVYGPGLREGIVYQAIHQALSEVPIEVYGDISTDFVYVKDVVRATIISLERWPGGYETYNIGSGQESTLHYVVSKIIELAKSHSELRFHKEPKARLWLDISKARRGFCYNPTPIEESLTDYINYVKDISSRSSAIDS